MASKKHLDLLLQGKEAWNDWREENPGELIDLSEAKIRDQNLSGFIMSGVNLSSADLSGSHFYQSDLYEAILSDAILQRTTLSHVDLSKVDLSNADLTEANITKTKLTGAKLRRANLSGAKLMETDLVSSDLAFTNLSGADLQGADLDNATLAFTILGNTNLQDVLNLDSCNHKAPSIIDQMTLLKSQYLPEKFLRGCGLSDEFIRSLPSLFWSSKSEEFFSCFISYSHNDIEFVHHLHDALQAHGIPCWLDEINLAPGDDIHDEIDKGIRYWDKFLLCCSKSSLERSWWVERELEKAIQKEEQLYKERGKKVLVLIPLALDDYYKSWQGGKRSIILSRVVGNFTQWKTTGQFDKEFNKLLRALRPNRNISEPPPKSLL